MLYLDQFRNGDFMLPWDSESTDERDAEGPWWVFCAFCFTFAVIIMLELAGFLGGLIDSVLLRSGRS